MSKIDLHIHTNISDGTYSPYEIINIAYSNKVNTISITDHDNFDAYTDKLFNYAKEKNITLITGIEISTKYKGTGVHILGYNLDINNKELNNTLLISRNARHKYLYDVSLKLKELGYILNVETLDKIDSVTKAHIAIDIINNNHNKDLLLKQFGHIPTKGEFIETIMNKNCPAYVKKDSISPIEATNLIRNANGIVVLAHPVCYIHEKKLTKEDIIEIINEIKPDGIEANYIYINRNGQKINDSNIWNEIATQYNLFSTIGSDFHTDDNIHPTIGLVSEILNTTPEYINTLTKHLTKTK